MSTKKIRARPLLPCELGAQNGRGCGSEEQTLVTIPEKSTAGDGWKIARQGPPYHQDHNEKAPRLVAKKSR